MKATHIGRILFKESDQKVIPCHLFSLLRVEVSLEFEVFEKILVLDSFQC